VHCWADVLLGRLTLALKSAYHSEGPGLKASLCVVICVLRLSSRSFHAPEFPARCYTWARNHYATRAIEALRPIICSDTQAGNNGPTQRRKQRNPVVWQHTGIRPSWLNLMVGTTENTMTFLHRLRQGGYLAALLRRNPPFWRRSRGEPMRHAPEALDISLIRSQPATGCILPFFR
jgi:hypothetical protein